MIELAPEDEEAVVSHRLDAIADMLVADPLVVTEDDVAAVESDIDDLVRGAGGRDDLRREVLA